MQQCLKNSFLSIALQIFTNRCKNVCCCYLFEILAAPPYEPCILQSMETQNHYWDFYLEFSNAPHFQYSDVLLVKTVSSAMVDCYICVQRICFHAMDWWYIVK